MAMERSDEYPGSSPESFTSAAIDAVDKAEKEGKLRPDDGEEIVLRMIKMEVTVHGPIGEYRIVLGPSH
jgi:flavin-binding protein dodecin